MADVKQIGGYDAMIMKVGYIFSGEISNEMWEIADIADAYNVNSSKMINVESTIEALEDKDEPLSETEQKLLDLCKAAEAQGLGDIVVNPE